MATIYDLERLERENKALKNTCEALRPMRNNIHVTFSGFPEYALENAEKLLND